MVMPNNDRNQAWLDLVVEGFRQQPIAEFTNPAIDFPATTEASNDSTLHGHVNQLTRDRSLVRRRIALLAALCVVLAVIGLSIAPWESESSRAFAQVQQAIRQLRSVVFEIKIYTGDALTHKGTLSYLPTGNIRMESALRTEVLDTASAQVMTVDDADRTVKIAPAYNLVQYQKQFAGAFEALLTLGPLPQTTMRTVAHNAQPAREFHAVWDGSTGRVLVDSKTNLPITMEIDRGTNAEGQRIREVIDNFKFNADLNRSLFSITPPDGYAVTRIEKREPLRSSEGLVLVAGQGLGDVKFGLSLQAVRDLLGDPDVWESRPAMVAEVDNQGQMILPMKMVPAKPAEQIGIVQYRSMGVQLELSSITGVQWIRCMGKQINWKPFAGATSEGIRIGMSKYEVKSLLSPVQIADKDRRAATDHWLLNGIDVEFDEQGKCVRISAGASSFSK